MSDFTPRRLAGVDRSEIYRHASAPPLIKRLSSSIIKYALAPVVERDHLDIRQASLNNYIHPSQPVFGLGSTSGEAMKGISVKGECVRCVVAAEGAQVE